MVAEKFQIYGVKITGEYLLESKNFIFTHAPKQSSPPRFLLSPLQAEGNYQSILNKFFENLFFTSRKGGVLRSRKNHQN